MSEPIKGEDGFYRIDGKKIVGKTIKDALGRPKWIYGVNHDKGTMPTLMHYDYEDEMERSERGEDHIVEGPMTEEWEFEENAE